MRRDGKKKGGEGKESLKGGREEEERKENLKEEEKKGDLGGRKGKDSSNSLLVTTSQITIYMWC